MKINCSFCGESICVNEYDFARWAKGEVIYCENCQEKFDNNISQTRRF